MAFEGELAGSITPDYLFAEDEEFGLTRGTLVPRQDFWVFRLNPRTKAYLKEDFMQGVGLTTNVLHVSIAIDGQVVFGAYDRFHEECVILHQTEWVSPELMDQLWAKGAISGVEELKIN